MPSKGYTLFFIASVGFVLISIALITILSRPQSEGTQDIRAKATVQNSLKLTGNVVSSNPDDNTLVVQNIKFENAAEDAASMGTFTITLPATISSGTFSAGQKVLVGVDAATFNTAAKTVTALSVVNQ